MEGYGFEVLFNPVVSLITLKEYYSSLQWKVLVDYLVAKLLVILHIALKYVRYGCKGLTFVF